jgi:hypothetical protein
LLDKCFDITEKAAGCYLEKSGAKVPFVKRNGTFVLLAKRQVKNLVAAMEVDGDMTAARGALTRSGKGGRSSGIPDGILMDKGRVAETLPPARQAVRRDDCEDYADPHALRSLVPRLRCLTSDRGRT